MPKPAAFTLFRNVLITVPSVATCLMVCVLYSINKNWYTAFTDHLFLKWYFTKNSEFSEPLSWSPVSSKLKGVGFALASVRVIPLPVKMALVFFPNVYPIKSILNPAYQCLLKLYPRLAVTLNELVKGCCTANVSQFCVFCPAKNIKKVTND